MVQAASVGRGGKYTPFPSLKPSEALQVRVSNIERGGSVDLTWKTAASYVHCNCPCFPVISPMFVPSDYPKSSGFVPLAFWRGLVKILHPAVVFVLLQDSAPSLGLHHSMGNRDLDSRTYVHRSKGLTQAAVWSAAAAQASFKLLRLSGVCILQVCRQHIEPPQSPRKCLHGP